MLQQELIDEIEQLLKETSGGITITSADGKRLILSVFPEALYPPKSRMDDLEVNQGATDANKK